MKYSFAIISAATTMPFSVRAVSSLLRQPGIKQSSAAATTLQRHRHMGTETDSMELLSSLHLKSEFRDIADKVTDTVWRDEVFMAAAALKGKAACTNPSTAWIQDQINRMGLDKWETLRTSGIMDFAWLYKYFIDQNEQGEYIGVDNQFTQEIKQRHDMAEDFWESTDHHDTIVIDNVILMGMHGSDLQSSTNVAAVLDLYWETQFMSPWELQQLNNDMRQFIASLPDGFDNPFLTLNALAFDGPANTVMINDGTVYPDAIIMGDGLLMKLEDFELETDGVDFIHAHEFGHHVIYETGMDDVNVLPAENEETRRIELLTDLLGAYFLTNPNGGDLCFGQVEEISQAGFSVGDCNVESDGHHGTPKQRKCAINFGATLSLRDAHNGVTPHPTQIGAEFQAALPRILALDDTVCSFQVPAGMEVDPCPPLKEPSAAAELTVAPTAESSENDSSSSESSGSASQNRILSACLAVASIVALSFFQ